MPYRQEKIFLKGVAKGKQWNETLKAIHVAELAHGDQKRKDGDPYLSHPIRIASALVAMKVNDDDTIAIAILHDVLEDCPEWSADKLRDEFKISDTIIRRILKLTKHSGQSTESYYEGIKEHISTILVKVADRCHNVSTMAGVFNKDKIDSYIKETEDYILPLCKHGSRMFPEFSDQTYTMKYHIQSILNTIKNLCDNGRQ